MGHRDWRKQPEELKVWCMGLGTPGGVGRSAGGPAMPRVLRHWFLLTDVGYFTLVALFTAQLYKLPK